MFRMLEQPAFGHGLKALRLERGLTQAALADGILSAGYLSRLESGERMPTPHVVERLAERLGVPAARLETVAGQPPLAQVLATVASADPDETTTDALADALRADESRNPALRWQALWLLARMRGDQGRREEEHGLLTELVALSEELGSAELTARTHTRLAGCAQVLGDAETARRHAETAYQRWGRRRTPHPAPPRRAARAGLGGGRDRAAERGRGPRRRALRADRPGGRSGTGPGAVGGGHRTHPAGRPRRRT
jgi:transcriptional regulator with XRE-family HTH domain